MAGVALGDIHLDFTWQAQLHIHGRFAWEAWDRWHWAARLDWFRRRRDARDARHFCVALSLVICMQSCGSSGMFFLSACVGMFDFGMFKFGHLHAKLLHSTHTNGQVLSCSWSRGRAQLRFSHAVQRRHDRFCFLHADFHRVVLVVLFWSLWPN